MGRKVRCLVLAAVISLSAVFAASADTVTAPEQDTVSLSEMEGASIEQISANMPEVTVYGYGLSEAGGTPEAVLGGTALEAVSSSPFEETGEGVDYYLLVDISNSIPDSYFREIKTAAVDLGQNLRPADRLTFITFGESVELRGDLTGEREAAEAVMKDIRNADNRTLLFEAVSKAADLAVKQTDPALKRKIFLVISDGEDVADGKAVAQEALDNLKEKAVSVFALCINDTARDHKNSFGEFARNTGGAMEIFRAGQCGEAMEKIRGHIMSADCLVFRAPTNRISHTYERLNLKLPGQEMPLTKEVFLYRFQDDNTAPTIKAEGLGGREIRVTFSEAVTGDGDPSSYQFRPAAGGDVIPISGVARDENMPDSVVLTVADAFPAGEYTLSCPGVKDDSQNENAVENSVTMTLEQSDEPSETVVIQEGDTNVEEKGESSRFAMAAALMALAAGITGIVLAVRNRSAKKNRPEEPDSGEIIRNGGTAGRTHVEIMQARELPLTITVSASGGEAKRIRKNIDRSLIVGRSGMCDLSFSDNRMSKQHFALEWDGQNMYIQDLQSTNGTIVNGVRLSGMKRKLERGDRISAGAEMIEISW